jgi:thiol-disulfide isomerase/thioredoxin
VIRRHFRISTSLVRPVLVVLAVAAASGCASGSSNGSDGAVTQVPFTAADGTAHTLASMKGTPVVLNMWATWCKPCVKEMPAFDEVASSQDAVRIIGVNVADDADDAAAFAENLGVGYEQFNDPTGALSDAFAVTGLPATAFVDADGNVVEVHAGAMTAEELRDRIATAFTGTTPGTTSGMTSGTTSEMKGTDP